MWMAEASRPSASTMSWITFVDTQRNLDRIALENGEVEPPGDTADTVAKMLRVVLSQLSKPIDKQIHSR